MNARLRRRFLFALIGFGAVMTLVSDRAGAGGIMSMMLGLLLLALALDIWLGRKPDGQQEGTRQEEPSGKAAAPPPAEPPDRPAAD
jgi:hypothetical protein